MAQTPQELMKIKGVTTPTKIGSKDLMAVPTTPVVTPEKPTTGASGVMGAVQSSQDQFTKSLEDARKTAEKNKETSLQDYTTQLFDAPTKTGIQSSAYESEGVNSAQKELDDINSQLMVEQRAFENEKRRIEDNAVGASMGQVQNMVNEAERKSLRKQADLAVVQMGLQGKYNTAKAIADRAVDAEVEREKNKLEALRINYEDNKALFTTAEQRQFESLLTDRQNKYNEDLASKKAISDYSIEAMKMGADGATITAIRNAKTPEEAQAIASEFISPIITRQRTMDEQSAALDMQYKQAQIGNIYSEIQKRNAESATPLIDPTNAIAYAQQYASTGKIPSGIPKGTFGIIAEAAKDLPKQKGQLLDASTGVAPDMDATSAQAYSALYSAIELSKQLKELDKERVGGVVAGSLGKVFGSDAQQKYVDLRSQVIDLLARARSGAALTVQEEKRYAEMLPGRFSEPLFLGADSASRIDNFTSTLTSDLQNKASSRGLVVNGLSKVDIGGTSYTVGDIVVNDKGEKGRINADGSVTNL